MRGWIGRQHPLLVILVAGVFVAITAFSATSLRAADHPRDFDLNDGLGGVHLDPYALGKESHFDAWTGLPVGWSSTSNPHGIGAATFVQGPVPDDMEGRRAMPLPIGFAIGVLLGFLLVVGARPGASAAERELTPARR